MESSKNITVFGATGRIGKELLNLLSEASISTIAVSRHSDKMSPMPFVQWMLADMAQKKSLYATMAQSKAVWLLSSMSEDFVTEQKNVIHVAQNLDVQHLVKLSSGAADIDSTLYIPKSHGTVETYLQTSGIPYTLLRANGMMQNWLGEVSQTVRQEHKIYESTGDGKRAYVDLRDIAEVAFKVLTQPQKHQNQTYLLTGETPVNYTQVAAAMSGLIGTPVTYVPLSLAEAKQQMIQSGMPIPIIETFLAYDAAQSKGQTEYVSSAVQDILQKPARSLETFLKDYLEYWR